MGAHCNTCTCKGAWVSMDDLEALSHTTGAPIEVDFERNRYVLSLGGAEFNAHMKEGS